MAVGFFPLYGNNEYEPQQLTKNKGSTVSCGCASYLCEANIYWLFP